MASARNNTSSATPTPAYQDEATLRKLYVQEELSVTEAANELDCAPSTVGLWLKEHGIKVRQQPSYPRLSERDSLYELYVEQQLTTTEIAEKVGSSQPAVANWLDRHGIEKRMPGYKVPEEVRDASYLRQEYLHEERTIAEISNHLDCSSDTVRKWLSEHDIPRRDEQFQPGEDHFNWRGGHINYYGPTWPHARDSAIERDEYECQRCGMGNESHKEIMGKALHVHHIIPFKSFSESKEANKLSNLITLCYRCHKKAERMAPLLPLGCRANP